MRITSALAIALGLLVQSPLVHAGQTAQPLARAPKLVVLITVDQMRGDYIDRFQHQWTKGLKRLVTDGAWFRRADYPYANTVTCAGHASISTGTVPAIHGMVLNEWWERNNSRLARCTDDETQQLVSFGGPVTGIGHSARQLMATTLADEMRLQLSPAPRVVSLSLKARSAINLGGHRPDVVAWFDDEASEWVTSTAFAKTPAPFVVDFVKAHPMAREVDRVWDRALPQEQYLYDGSALGRQKTAFATTAFPHFVKGATAEAGVGWADAWKTSPFADAYVAGLAAASLDALSLGRGAGIDVLALSFSGLDEVGHDFGPDSHEIQDIMVRLDAELGALLDKLDRDVGRDQYVVGLTADHGVAPVPERVKAQGFDAGRINTAALGRAIDAVLERELGGGPFRTRVIYSDIYFNEGVYEKLSKAPEALAAVIDTIRGTEGVARIYRREQLSMVDPMTRPSALSHYDGRSGDLIMLGRAHWITSTSTSTHGTAHAYDQRVPVLLYGRGIKPGEYLEPASPLDLAPTLAFLTGVTLPDAFGRLLTEAIAPGR